MKKVIYLADLTHRGLGINEVFGASLRVFKSGRENSS